MQRNKIRKMDPENRSEAPVVLSGQVTAIGVNRTGRIGEWGDDPMIPNSMQSSRANSMTGMPESHNPSTESPAARQSCTHPHRRMHNGHEKHDEQNQHRDMGRKALHVRSDSVSKPLHESYAVKAVTERNQCTEPGERSPGALMLCDVIPSQDSRDPHQRDGDQCDYQFRSRSFRIGNTLMRTLAFVDSLKSGYKIIFSSPVCGFQPLGGAKEIQHRLSGREMSLCFAKKGASLITVAPIPREVRNPNKFQKFVASCCAQSWVPLHRRRHR